MNEIEKAIAVYEDNITQMELNPDAYGDDLPRFKLVLTTLREQAKLTKAKADGRLVELPCKVGDIVYADCYGDIAGGDEMLTEKQLQALVDCEEKEDCAGETCPMFEICDNDYTNRGAAEAAQTALSYRKTLELKLPENGFEVLASDGGGKITFERLTISPEDIETLQRENKQLKAVLKQARVALEEIEKCCEINVDDGYHTCQRKCREAAARARFVREVIDELEESE